MFNLQPGNTQPGNSVASGSVTGVTLGQTGFFTINVTWGFEPLYPISDTASYNAACQDTSFGIYLNGRLVQIQPGVIRSATIIAPNADTHEVDVIAWSSQHKMPDNLYIGASIRRAHLEWEPVAASDLASYKIYHATTPNPTTLYATQSTIAVDGVSFDFTSGASVVISGAPDPVTAGQYQNCTFTLTVTDADNGVMELTNDHDAETQTLPFAVGQPVVALDGISIVVTEAPAVTDTLTFPVRVLTYYDTASLSAGTHYFAISAVDNFGNESPKTSDIPVVVPATPEPVTAFTVDYDTDTDYITYNVAQSATGASVKFYSNYDPSTNTLMDDVYYIAPLLTIALTASATETGNLLDATGLPAGSYKFAARSVTAGNDEDDSTTTDDITLPYDNGALEIISATITQISSTAYTLTWIADDIPSGDWTISWTPNDGSDTTGPIPTDAGGGFLGYSYTGTVPGSGEHTFTITAGKPYNITTTFDTTAPGTPTGATGTAY